MNENLKQFQLDKMTKFIEHDADKIEQKIDKMTKDDYLKEKEKLILKGIMEINQLYNKNMKRLNKETVAMISTKMNNAKLEILQRRDKHIKFVMADVNKELIKLRSNKIHYKKILKNLILQSMYQILEEEINLILVSDDVKYVESMIDELKDIYQGSTGKKIQINIEYFLMLPREEIGGVVITAKNRTVIVENTLVNRLLHIAQQTIPLIRCGLFGPNPTRTHTSAISYS